MSQISPNHVLISTRDLVRVDRRPDLRSYLSKIWDLRHYILEDAKAKRFAANHGLLLGWVWTVLSPLLDAAMYGIIFGILLRTSHGIDNFVGYVVLGVTFFSFFSAGLSGGANSIRSTRNLITNFGLPFAVAPISIAVKNFLNGIAPAVVATLFALAFQGFANLSLKILLVIPLYLLIHLFSAGLLLAVARIAAFVPDIRSILNFVNRAWFYSSGVFFSITRFTDNQTIIRLAELNPAYVFLQSVRDCVLYDQIPPLRSLTILTLTSLLTFLVGLVFFWQAEDRYVGVR